jgi:Icc-related predicted phosphoesterase
MRLGQLSVLPSMVALFMLGGCKKELPPAPTPQPAAPRVQAPPAAVSGKTQPDCVGPFTAQGESTELTIEGRTFKRTGATLTVTNPDADHQVVLGVLANFKEVTAENLINLKKYFAFFTAEKAEAILVDGDSGDTSEEIKASLEAIAQTKLPVLVIPGNREPRADFQKAVAEVNQRHPNVLNLTQIRLVNFDDASIVSLPGYYDRRYLTPGAAGCQYFKEDVDGLTPILAAATYPVVLLSHAEPHGTTPDAIDAFPEGNAGDNALTLFLQAHPVPFGVFANMHEAGGRATDLASAVIRPGEAREKLYLNPGAADATPWPLNDGTRSYGMAATLTIDEGKGSYRVYRAPELNAAEQAAIHVAEEPPVVKEVTAKTKP